MANSQRTVSRGAVEEALEVALPQIVLVERFLDHAGASKEPVLCEALTGAAQALRRAMDAMGECVPTRPS